jgi:hypothetical protein
MMSNSSPTVPTTSWLSAGFWSIVLTYCGLFIILASTLAHTWSAVASLLTFYQLLVAPLLMGIVAYRNRSARLGSAPYRLVFYAAAGYFVVLPLWVGVLVLLD